MRFQDKYTNDWEKDLPENKDKLALSTETFVIGEMLDYVIIKLEQLRRK